MDHNIDHVSKILRWVETCDFKTSVTSIQGGAVHIKIHLKTKADMAHTTEQLTSPA